MVCKLGRFRQAQSRRPIFFGAFSSGAPCGPDGSDGGVEGRVKLSENLTADRIPFTSEFLRENAVQKAGEDEAREICKDGC
jgi:hypothetical protein